MDSLSSALLVGLSKEGQGGGMRKCYFFTHYSEEICIFSAFPEMSHYYKHIRTAHAVEEERLKVEESVETHIVVVEPTSSAVEGT